MATWQDISKDSLLAAEALLRNGHFRSCVSRAYYSAYCAATHEIVQKLTTFSYGWNNPSHQKLTTYVQNNLILPKGKKDTIVILISTLRQFREDADYRPHVEIDAQIAEDCIRNANSVHIELWGGTP